MPPQPSSAPQPCLPQRPRALSSLPRTTKSAVCSRNSRSERSARSKPSDRTNKAENRKMPTLASSLGRTSPASCRIAITTTTVPVRLAPPHSVTVPNPADPSKTAPTNFKMSAGRVTWATVSSKITSTSTKRCTAPSSRVLVRASARANAIAPSTICTAAVLLVRNASMPSTSRRMIQIRSPSSDAMRPNSPTCAMRPRAARTGESCKGCLIWEPGRAPSQRVSGILGRELEEGVLWRA
mmetsp:Transcript_28191/g.60050  ORF Transcript_28191/g.60050 Transcript_28191/m.60050 type:complete len:239 (+) Transcript_28191:198-914(+)